jgi:Neuraminidase (sialidase)
MVIVKGGSKTTLGEKNNNLMKVIESEATRKSFDAIIDIVNRNNKTQPYVDAGGTPAVILAYTKGVITSILNARSMLNEADQRSLDHMIQHLWKAQKEAGAILNSM